MEQTLPTDEAPSKRRPGRPRLEAPSADYLERTEEIIAAAARVFHERGYDAGTLDDVAQALELRRASLYYYVRSKANLLNMLIERGLDIGLAEFDKLTQISDPTERLKALIRLHVRTVAGDPSLFSVFFDNRTRLEPQYESNIRAKERRYFNVLREAVVAAAEDGRVKFDTDDLRYATQAIFGMCTWCYKWFKPGVDDADRLADLCIALVFDGAMVAARTPRKRASGS